MHSVNCVHGSGCANSLLQELGHLGVVLSIDGEGRLTYDAPSPLGDELLSRLRANRDELLAAVEQFEDRAAIVEAKQIPTAKAVVETVVDLSGYLPVMNGMQCPWCRSCELLRLVDATIWCDSCNQLAFRCEGDNIVRADCVKQSELAEGMQLKSKS